ncbi:PKD domain-containing protein [Massilia sp. PAMC28688]|uniref:PKD domain-containing protein n=1 Tax=Massilia sp. PAMC28688 TaxID=2861283 RepID=UPI001C62E145|nr:PKD domain-containing protein [Massilia sp. PAMC28688]QYF92635.1 PKD domain-containing protein [Massilia sp. PAMC28688]
MNFRLRRFVVLITFTILTGCGGEGDAKPANTAPTANAGPGQSVDAGSVVTLSGIASVDTEKQPLTYAWQIVTKPEGSQATLSNASLATPTITADIAGNYTISLVVNDGQLSSTASSVGVSAKVSKNQFLTYIATKTCITSPRIYVIDQHIVFVTGNTGCSDIEPIAVFESIPEKQVCFGATFAQGRSCTDAKYNDIFMTAAANRLNPSLGLTGRTVELIHP